MSDSISTNIKTESDFTEYNSLKKKKLLCNSKFFSKIAPKPIIEQVLGKFWLPNTTPRQKKTTHVYYFYLSISLTR
jgi:hypothetical protein